MPPSRPRLAQELARFFPEAEALRASLKSELEAASPNPLHNPVDALALSISERLADKTYADCDLENLVQYLVARAFLFRVHRLADYAGETDFNANVARIEQLLRALATADDGGRLPPDVYADRLRKEWMGLVITAHPTFCMTEIASQDMADLAVGCTRDGTPLTADQQAEILERTGLIPHGTPAGIDLASELDQSYVAVEEINRSLRTIYETAVNVAQDLYPDDWAQFCPRLITVASWVGFDLDGRRDIGWNTTYRARVESAVRQLTHYQARAAELCEAISGETPALPLIDLQERLAVALRIAKDDLAAIPEDGNDAAGAAILGRRVASHQEGRLTNPASLVRRLDAAIELQQDPAVLKSLLVLKAQVSNLGLGMAHTHFRLNASQLFNALSQDVALDTAPDDRGNRRTYLRALTRLLDQAVPVQTNFGTVAGEKMSARRLFMLLSQIKKYVDGSTPIRFLIAECETAFAVLAALYLARLFDVEDVVDISPLFETSTALEHGHAIIDELLANPHYRAYVQQRGRLCIQTGYSDAGRYVGQVAASLAVERLKIKLASVLSAHGMDGVELVVFDTHGESIGRGAHPVSFQDRLCHVSSPATRLQFALEGLTVKQEVSFQGGDGYVYFRNKPLSFAVLSRLFEHGYKTIAQTENESAKSDQLYLDTDFSLEFFINLTRYNQELFENPNYATLLSVYGTNLLYPTGSRKTKRQHEGRGAGDHGHPSQIRAIPNNAILQQMGFLSNSLGGVGNAISKDPDHFAEIYGRSETCQRFMRLVHYAYRLSSLDVISGYLETMSPMFWLRRARVEPKKERRAQMLRIGRLLSDTQRYAGLDRVFRELAYDTINLKSALDALDLDKPLAVLDDNYLIDRDLLHATRLAMVQEILLVAGRTPRFSSDPEITIDDVISELLHVDVLPAVDALERAFPLSDPKRGPLDFGEPSTYAESDGAGYAPVHNSVITPLKDWYDRCRRAGVGITYLSGAVG